MGIIYKIENKINKKIYIGMTNYSLEKRLSEHINGRKNGNNSIIHKAIKKYGIENFRVDIIDKTNDRKELAKKEKYWISFYNSCERGVGYNIANGGQGCLVKRGRTPSDEARKKMSLARVGLPPSHTTPHTEKSKRLMSEKRRGVISEYCKNSMKKIVCVNDGIVHESIEACARFYSVYPQNILKVLNGKRNHTSGLSFELYEK